MKKYIVLFIALFSVSIITAQTASVTIGCAPLEVDFTSPDLSSYYWEFGNGNNSNLEDPSHNYINPGVYTAELFEGVGGAKIGEIIITVLSPPEIAISSSEQAGCSPFQVQFMNESVVDPNGTITGYFWDFGDGGNSTEENPVHNYASEGVFSVSLRIESDLIGCTTTQTFEDYISVSGQINAGFSIDNLVLCDAPATFNITNNTIDMSGYTYNWDFGNGQTSTDYNPPPANYDNEGSYTITMVVDSGDGCVVTITRTVTIGKPKIDIDFPDTVCLDAIYFIQNATQANAFSWTFGSGAVPQASSAPYPEVKFTQPGSQIITFSAIASSACQSDTFFNVFVQDPNAEFTIDPLTLCSDPATYTFTHPESGLAQYLWYIEELDSIFSGGPQYEFVYDEPTRDSFYISRPDTFSVFLDILTTAGCRAIDSTLFIHRAPRARMVPNVSRGCAPLTVNFNELSESTEDIISWSWFFGDGDTAMSNAPDDMTHTYTEPGEYYVKLAIENEAGCRDTSAGIFIYVGEPLESDFVFDQTEICLYDTVNFEALNLDPRIDAYHFDTDGGRISDCYDTPDASHTFVHEPGTYPVTLELEYNGCFNTIDNGQTITVNGTKSRIQFMTNCIDPYTVMFRDSSVNATTSIWYINGDTINMDTIPGDVFNYTFDDTGDYVIKLWTDDDTACPPDSSTVDVYIRDIEANFDFPTEVCAYTPITIDASASIDVDETCSKGYEWFGIANRPRQVDYPEVEAAYNPGPITVRLIVEDLNGCKDTLDKESQAYEVRASFEAEKNIICFPSTMSFTDLSTADTTIVDWSWSFGSNEQNPTDELFVLDTNDEFLTIQLNATDVLGCMDSFLLSIPIYEPTTDISFSPGNVVCLGETINFTSTDFTDQGSFLNYNWSFGTMGTSTDQNPSLEVTEPGITTVSLIITEESTGCTNEYLQNIQGIIPPNAEFIIDAENPDRICPDEIVLFSNLSTLDGPGGYLWDFGNGSTAFVENPSSFFDVGTYDISLTVSSIYGCSDTFTEQITLEGPQGEFTIDREFLCLGDTVTFDLLNTSNVSTFEWDFGDGTTLQNETTTSHPYTFLPDTLMGTLRVSVILESENGCKRTFNKFIEISDLEAGFEIVQDTTSICTREVQFLNTSLGADTYAWNFGNGETSTEENPLVFYADSDTFAITLNVEVAGGICDSEVTKELIISALDRALVPTVISPNNDEVNDNFDIIIPEDQRECVEVIKSKIYNRWGNLIYDNELPPEGWNGRYDSGEEAPAEIYTYILEVLYSNGETELFKGRFTLIR
ncbi:MAG: PKD domain-containing protein [Saprospiraceae bacterium]|nr:PKD domain-containing protein [Saprospiraceae bacterium]